ncbi:ABC transporter ATP-binding protein [Salipiger pacificus]|uniref:ABC transporter ATP-binding protein n=1 Tax=Alloyangia sp. H15 TaxID=3029062 RepID=A0AAU8AKX3_9RHOB|nr:ABC transporter ATP-binding protein [Alloyangia pacifica]
MKLDVKDLVAGYGKLMVLHDVGFSAEPGEITCVLGPNGAGKSTLMKTIAGHLPVSGGTIVLDGRRVDGQGALTLARAGIGYVAQEGNTFAELSVRDNLQASALAYEGTGARVNDVLSRFPILKERARQAASTLSGGERQTLAIANALIAGPRLLILDEPTAGLAPIFVDRIVAWVRELAENGMTVIWVVEQDPKKVLQVSKTSWFLESGRVRATMPSAQLLERGALQELLLQTS